MTKIQNLRESSQSKGIEVLQLDAGDFGEGTSFFLTENGSSSIKALDLLGTEITVIGNHDHMIGGNILGQQIRRANGKTKFLSANLVQTPEMELGELIRPYVDLIRGGIKIRVIGLSTAEPHFQYQLKPGMILPPVPVGITQSLQARQEGKELVIALTHIGQATDVKLANQSSEIDLIVGGHSHDFIENVRWEKNKKNKSIPIVQAGAHGLVVGSLMINLTDSGKVEVVEYKLHKIDEIVEETQEMNSLVFLAEENRNIYFGGRWEEIIGETWVPLSGYKNGRPSLVESCWGKHMARMTSESSGAHIGIHLADFEGEEIPAGEITFGDMIDNFPHFRNYGDFGWEISTINVKGSILKALVAAIINLKDKFGISFHGITYKSIKVPDIIPYLGGKIVPFYMRVAGQPIYAKNSYSVAFPSEVAFALKESLPETSKKLFPSMKNSGNFYWKVMEDYIRKNSPIRCR